MKKSDHTLYYFTSSFPYGLGETWKSNELKFLTEFFDKIIVVPYSYGGNFDNPKPLPEGVTCSEPLFREDSIPFTKCSFLKLLDRNFFYYLQEAFRRMVFFDKKRASSWIYSSLHVQRLLAHPFIMDLLQASDTNAILYFFWGKGSCDFLPFVKKNGFFKIMVRFHRYDLFEDQNSGYIPYRLPLLKSASISAPSSSKGLAHLSSLYPAAKDKMRIVPLGVVGDGTIENSSDNVLRILSCSYVVPIKRVEIIAEALGHLSIPVQWIHVGDGPLMHRIHEHKAALPGNIKVILPGMLDTSKLFSFYKQQPIDLFINVSSSEGVPVSIMEALSLSIPVFATDVGGTSDIVDDSVGKLLKPDISAVSLAEELLKYYNLLPEIKKNVKAAAFNRYVEKCNAEILTRSLANLLLE